MSAGDIARHVAGASTSLRPRPTRPFGTPPALVPSHRTRWLDIGRTVPAHSEELFERVVCGVDGTSEGLDAARQAGRLVNRLGVLSLVSICDTALAAETGYLGADVVDQVREEAEQALGHARRAVGGVAVEQRLVEGSRLGGFCEELTRANATLAVVGTHGHNRFTSIALGHVTAFALRHAPCSVLVAKRSARPQLFPGSIVCGVDGTRQSERAAHAAAYLKARFGARLRFVVAEDGKSVGFRAASRAVVDPSDVEILPGNRFIVGVIGFFGVFLV